MEEEDEHDSFWEPISSHGFLGTMHDSLSAPQSAMHVGTRELASVRNRRSHTQSHNLLMLLLHHHPLRLNLNPLHNGARPWCWYILNSQYQDACND
jgi:hypothetical protein